MHWKSGDLVGCHHSGTNKQRKGKIELLIHCNWTMEGRDEQKRECLVHNINYVLNQQLLSACTYLADINSDTGMIFFTDSNPLVNASKSLTNPILSPHASKWGRDRKDDPGFNAPPLFATAACSKHRKRAFVQLLLYFLLLPFISPPHAGKTSLGIKAIKAFIC